MAAVVMQCLHNVVLCSYCGCNEMTAELKRKKKKKKKTETIKSQSACLQLNLLRVSWLFIPAVLGYMTQTET